MIHGKHDDDGAGMHDGDAEGRMGTMCGSQRDNCGAHAWMVLAQGLNVLDASVLHAGGDMVRPFEEWMTIPSTLSAACTAS